MPVFPSSSSRRANGRHRQPRDDARARAALGQVTSPQGGTAGQRQGLTPVDPTLAIFATDGELVALSNERRELLCSVIGLGVKFGLVAVAAVSLFRLSAAYQQRMDRQGEISAVLELESAKLIKSRERFDQLFTESGEQQLIREQSQWIAPNRLRVVWQSGGPFSTVETANVRPSQPLTRP